VVIASSPGERETAIVNELYKKGGEIGGDADQVAVAWLLHHPAPIVSSSCSLNWQRSRRGNHVMFMERQ